MEYPKRSCGDVVGTIVNTKEIMGIVVAVNALTSWTHNGEMREGFDCCDHVRLLLAAALWFKLPVSICVRFSVLESIQAAL